MITLRSDMIQLARANHPPLENKFRKLNFPSLLSRP
uniref:Uncharacterized protein n=1 Tax=Pristionchus pacificus TaxID=54126 RepID=A0A2A6BDR9_PRIPA|eukprot:PDM64045.1 hypothetical protein PRIPAC_54289 [Pristionchus pacificus]